MNLRMSVAAGLAALLFVLPAGASAPPDPIAGRVVLRLDEDAAARLRAGSLALPAVPGAESVTPRIEPLFPGERGRLGRFALVTFPPSAALGAGDPNEAWLEAFRTLDGVESAASDVLLRAAALPDDPGLLGYWGPGVNETDSTWVRQKHLVNPGGAWSLEATRAWPFVPGDAGLVVAVLDSGVDWQHPDLGGPAMGDGLLWRNETEFAGIPGVDDDGNGFVDDFIGWDFVDSAGTADWGGCFGAEDCDDEDNDPMDFQGHGTFVAGSVTALTDNGTGLAGHDGALRIMAVRIAWGISSANTSPTLLARGVLYAARNGARVINVSYQTARCAEWVDPSCTADTWGLEAALDEAVTVHDAVVVGSAGNENNSSGYLQYLAQRDDCLGVAAVDSLAQKTTASNFGPWVDVAAFGSGNQGYASLWYNGLEGLRRYRAHPSGGTSFAAPMVAALAGLLRTVEPDATAAEVRGLVLATRRDIGNANLGGLVDYAAAVQSLSGGWDVAGSASALVPGPAGEIVHRAGSDLAFTAVENATTRVVTAIGPAASPVPPAAARTDAWRVVLEEGGGLALRDADGVLLPGWPVALDAPLRSLHLADLEAALGAPEVIAVTRDSLLVLESDGTPRFSRAFDPGAVVVGAFETTVAGLQVATVDDAGEVRMYDRDGLLVDSWTRNWSPDGAVIAAVGLQFRGGEEPCLAFLTENLKDDTSGLHAVRRDSARFAIPFLPSRGGGLSVIGDTEAGEAYLLVQLATGLSEVLLRVDGDGLLRSRVLGGAVAGEPLVADLGGDWNHEVLVLRLDGTLLGFDTGLAPIPGFPRRFPGAVGREAAPALVDDPARRRLLLADEAGTLWSLPLGPSDRPSVWGAAGGDAGRTRFVTFDRATPLLAAAILTATAGEVCWEGRGFEVIAGLRLRVRPGGADETSRLLPVRDRGCAAVGGNPGDRVVLEGRDRVGTWELLGETRLRGTPAPVLAASPNPFRGSTELRFAPLAARGVLEVYDVGGRRLARAELAPGADRYAWDGAAAGGRATASGIYFVRLLAGGEARTLRIVRLP